jgi:predicted enzyme related to lactoylglutathione lyase
MNKVVHFEIPFDDEERAIKFYKGCFGWKTEEYPEMKYIIVRTGPVGENMMPEHPGFINGGMMKRKQIRSPVITIEVDDIDAALKNVKQHGGKTHTEKITVGNMGFSAYFEDSEGNVVGLWQNTKI